MDSSELTTENFPELKNDRILRAARNEPVDKIPIWIMRQAGRYLPEFMELRREYDFFQICRTPELACEVTLMPLNRFHLDAAIIFSDILVTPQALGMEVRMEANVGPVFPNPLRDVSDLKRLTPENALQRLKYVGDAITLTRHKLEGKVPLIGFAGAPWTIMSYMIEGGGSKTMNNAKRWLYKHPTESKELLQMITDLTIEYLIMQANAGAQLLQVFESHCEYLSPYLFDFVKPYLRKIAAAVKRRTSFAVPMILFCKGGLFCLHEQTKLGYDVLGIDWTVDPKEARKIVGENVVLQGNLDPVALQANAGKITDLARDMIRGFGKKGYIANLGHGIYPDTPYDSVPVFIDAVHSYRD